MDLKNKLEQIILENIADEKFGVGELAEQAGMSRSTLLRKLQKESELSAGQLIRKVRLDKAKELLNEGNPTISEVSYQVGFNSTSYFIKCFKEEFGQSPGEFQKQELIEETVDDAVLEEGSEEASEEKVKFRYQWILYLLGIFLATMIIWLVWKPDTTIEPLDKSVAVLPFKNNSEDYSNIYVVNGVMDAVLNNLQKISDLKVISRQSVEQYRNSEKSIKEIASDLEVSYLVEGSGQKHGDKILLNVQLIDGKNDRQIWSEVYEKDLVDIFKMQRDIAEVIAKQVNAKITPEEQKRLEEVPTDDMVAYDYFLQGMDLLNDPSGKGLEPSIPLFNMAIERDPEFARAYAAAAISYYYMDIFQAEKKHKDQVNYYAEKAFLLQPKLPQALIAKAFSYMMKREFETAVTYLEKALEYHPNSAFVIQYLADFYANYIPNSPKYLEYSLKGLQLDKSTTDSISMSFMYLHVSNAFLQTGFLDQALLYINRSLDYNSRNIYSQYVKAYVYFARDRDIKKVNKRLLEIYQMDTTRIDVVQELAKSYYNHRDFKNAWVYYQKLIKYREEQNMNLYLHENIKIAWTCKQLGLKEQEAKNLEEYKEFTEIDASIYKPLLQASYYAYINDTAQAMHYLEEFSHAEDFHIWILMLPGEPHLENITSLPAFDSIMHKMETYFGERHEEIRERLNEEGLI
jgi:TolB-like protein/AraC-like DNA-binding protein